MNNKGRIPLPLRARYSDCIKITSCDNAVKGRGYRLGLSQPYFYFPAATINPAPPPLPQGEGSAFGFAERMNLYSRRMC